MNYTYKYLKYKKKYLQLIGGSESLIINKEIIYENGDIYNGQTLNDKKHGQGIMKYANGNVYDGSWNNDKRHGQGTITFNNDDVYEGEWKDDNIDGQGTMTFHYGDNYEGEWNDFYQYGQGTMKYANGDNYEGNWINDFKNGPGKMKYDNGNIYEGNWVNDLKSGQGIMNYVNGNHFNGTWDNDMPNTGLLTLVDNTIIEYHDGKQINNKPEDFKSIPIIDQQENDCWAHAISRNFVRTFQILSIIKFEFIQKFYDLFYTILTEYKTCKEGYHQSDAMFYLFNYLKKNYNDYIFTIIYENKECTQLYCNKTGVILNIDQENKDQIIEKLKDLFDKNLLFIGNYYYTVNQEGKNTPTKAIKIMLDCKLQPVVTININEYLNKQLNTRTINLPSVEEKINFDNNCKYDDGHIVNLRKWYRNYIEFKNSWGTYISNEGNFSVVDLKYLVCKDDKKNKNKNILEFTSLMFDYIKFGIPLEKYSSYYSTFDITLETKKQPNYNGHYNYYGLYHGQGELTYNNGAFYKGKWENGNRHGQGKLTYSDEIYVGEWKDNSRHGQGIKRYSNGDIYDGEWKYNEKHGQGKMTYNSGDKYVGKWKDGEIHGQGIMKYFNGNVYDGEWENDEMYGQGIMKYFNGDVYDGEWKNDVMYGQGIMKYFNDDVYNGGWKDNVMYGQGIMKYFNGDVYNGGWKDNVMHGQGIMKYFNGDVYDGEWANDTRHGQGTYTSKYGYIYVGKWKDGNREI